MFRAVTRYGKLLFIPWFVLMLAMVGTFFAWKQQQRILVSQVRVQFEHEIDRTRTSILSNVSFYEDVLWNMRSLLASNGDLSYADWAQFVNELAIEQTYPGIVGVGVVEYVSAESAEQFVGMLRQNGLPSYELHHHAHHGDIYAVKYADSSMHQMGMMGIDIKGHPTLRLAAEHARDNGDSAISAKVMLSDWVGEHSAGGEGHSDSAEMEQSHTVDHGSAETMNIADDNHPELDAGFFIFQPFYRSDMPLHSAKDRQAALVGWVYMIVNSHDLMHSIIGLDTSLIHFEIFDGDEPIDEAMLFNHATGIHDSHVVTEREHISILVGGRRWTLEFGKLPAFVELVNQSTPLLTAIGGSAISLACV